ncbi:MAG: stage II sporulation protein M [Methanosphaera stadtmanae]|nr:stage II sporulation protein M [Methanosphaera stadtmanae]
MKIKEISVSYIHRMKYYVLLSLIIFLASLLLSYVYPGTFQSLVLPAVQGLNQGVQNGTVKLETIPLFTNNFSVALSLFAGGVYFSIPTLYLLIYNGLVIGFTGAQLNLSYFLTYTLPHGIVELSAIVLAGATGFRITHGIITLLSGIKIKGSNKSKYFKEHGIIAIKMIIDAIVLILLVAILLLIAAYIEANLTIPIGNLILGS